VTLTVTQGEAALWILPSVRLTALRQSGKLLGPQLSPASAGFFWRLLVGDADTATNFPARRFVSGLPPMLEPRSRVLPVLGSARRQAVIGTIET
jgi:hypothetical protein